MGKYQIIIGRFEHIDVVGGVYGVPAKIDTGAYTSSIHANYIEQTTEENGDAVLKFRLLGYGSYPASKLFTTKDFVKRTVISSSGHSQIRYGVKLKIQLAGKTFIASFTLSDRSRTVFPVLIARKALKNRFLVDPAKSSISRPELKKSLISVKSEEDLEGITV